MAFATLTASMLLGLSITTKAGGTGVSRSLVFEMHQFLSVLSVVLVGIHGGALLFDEWISFSAVDILVPFAGEYEPFWTCIGIIAAWLTAVITASFWLKRYIGRKAWRQIHFFTFVSYFMALFHGVGAGTDSQEPVVYWGYVLSAAAVILMTWWRIFDALNRRPGSAQPGRTGSQTATS
jgi:sulfoxide reductase heme-binding subunit YedZ